MLTAELTMPADLHDAFREQWAGRDNVVLRTVPSTDAVEDFAGSVAAGLKRQPRRLESRFLYDARGSELYEQITTLPEYYLTRAETAILSRWADDVRAATGPVTLVELGSGSSVKTDLLLAAYGADGRAVRYVPIDVSYTALAQAGEAISRRRPGVRVIGIHGTYEAAFPVFRAASPLMVLFLGSTVGNLDRDETAAFLSGLAAHLADGDFLLMGVDLVKDAAALEAAYNDSAGVTAAFTRNLFVRMNRELNAGLDLEAIRHVARYVPSREQVEIGACFDTAQRLRVGPLDRSFDVAAGEEIRTEISRKYRLRTWLPYVESFGFRTRKVYTDAPPRFALLLLQRTT